MLSQIKKPFKKTPYILTFDSTVLAVSDGWSNEIRVYGLFSGKLLLSFWISEFWIFTFIPGKLLFQIQVPTNVSELHLHRGKLVASGVSRLSMDNSFSFSSRQPSIAIVELYNFEKKCQSDNNFNWRKADSAFDSALEIISVCIWTCSKSEGHGNYV